MCIKFRVVPKKNPRDLNAAPKYYAVAVSAVTVDIDGLSKMVTDGSTVRQNDVYAVAIGLVNAMQYVLSEGHRVKLGKMGTFSIGVKGKGVELKEDYNASSIVGAKMRFRAGAEFRKMLAGLTFTKID